MKAEDLHAKLIKTSLEYLLRILEKIKKFPEYKFLNPDEKHSFFIKNFHERKVIREITDLYFELLESSFHQQYFFVGCISSVAIKEFQKRVTNEIKPWLGQTESDVYAKILEEYNEILEYHNIDCLDDIYYVSNNLENGVFWTEEEEVLMPYYLLQDRGNLEEPIWFSELKKTLKYLNDKVNTSINLEPESETIIKNIELESTLETEEQIDRKLTTALLFELGIIDYLKENSESPNITNGKIATILSKITHFNEGTLRKYINSTYNEDYSSDDLNVAHRDKAKEYLLNKGYKIKL